MAGPAYLVPFPGLFLPKETFPTTLIQSRACFENGLVYATYVLPPSLSHTPQVTSKANFPKSLLFLLRPLDFVLFAILLQSSQHAPPLLFLSVETNIFMTTCYVHHKTFSHGRNKF